MSSRSCFCPTYQGAGNLSSARWIKERAKCKRVAVNLLPEESPMTWLCQNKITSAHNAPPFRSKVGESNASQSGSRTHLQRFQALSSSKALLAVDPLMHLINRFLDVFLGHQRDSLARVTEPIHEASLFSHSSSWETESPRRYNSSASFSSLDRIGIGSLVTWKIPLPAGSLSRIG